MKRYKSDNFNKFIKNIKICLYNEHVVNMIDVLMIDVLMIDVLIDVLVT